MNDPNIPVTKHLDEMTCLLYVERQLERDRALEVSAHTQTCGECRTLLRALERESRLLTRAMLEEDEPLPARIAAFQQHARQSMQWIWGVVFALAATGMYALYTSYIQPWEQQLQQAGFGGTNLLGLLIFQGAFWKGWQSMFTLFEVLGLVMVAGVFAVFFRKRLRRTSALALVITSFCAVLALPGPAAAAEFRKGDSVEVRKDETIKGDTFLSGGRVRVDGTIDGDLYLFTQSADVNGHVTGDVISFAKGLRITGQVDGNVRSFVNALIISGTVGKNVLTFNETSNVDSSGKIGGSFTAFAESVSLDGKLGKDFLGFFNRANITGTVGGSFEGRGGEALVIGSTAVMQGRVHYKGDKPAEVSSEAKLASPVEFEKMEHEDRHGTVGYIIWLVIWSAASGLLGLVLFALMPRFAQETVRSGEQYGLSFGLGALVLIGAPIAAMIACITIVGLLVGISTFVLWIFMMLCTHIVVGGVIGQWMLGRTTETWPLIGRMVLGLLLLRAVGALPYLGGWVKFAVILWGMGAISLAIYRKLQPVIAPGIPGAPIGPGPLPPSTTVGGMQTA